MPVTYRCVQCKKTCNCKKVDGSVFSYCCSALVVEEPVVTPKELETSGKNLAKRVKDRSEAREILLNRLNEIGLDAESMAGKLKTAIDHAMTRGKVFVIKKRGNVEFHYEPDLDAAAKLMMIWSTWTSIGKQNGTGTTNNTINFGGTDPGETKQLITAIRKELEQRGLPGVLPGHPQVKDSPTLRGVVDVGPGEEETIS